MKKILRFLLAGFISGFITVISNQLENLGLIPNQIDGRFSALYVNRDIIVFILFFGLIYFTLAIPLARFISDQLEEVLYNYPMQEILMYIIGLGIGLYVASLGSTVILLDHTSLIGQILGLLMYIGLGSAGIYLVHIKKQEIKGWISKTGDRFTHLEPKILDTSVIIDGRILDIISTGFVEGKIVIPSFVLDELRHIADSSDALKRNRGRRGLDILNELKNNKLVPVEVMDVDYEQLTEVDSKLLRLANDIQGKVVTNDFNLNKVARLQKVQVLNINDLANAIKQVVLPNEELEVTVIKEGKENNQGVAYLNDGTMIVIEGGKKYVGSTIKVLVSTVLQTSAGRMIFAKVLG